MHYEVYRLSLARLRVFTLAILVPLLLVASRDARAQDTQPLVHLIADVHSESLNGMLGNIENNEEFFVDPGFSSYIANDLLSRSTVAELAGFPIGSSSGGFTYLFDSTNGLAVRSSPSFGPAFAERPLTSGRGKLNIGLTYLHRSFGELEGKDLSDGSLKIHGELYWSDTHGAIDLVESTFRLKMKADTFTTFATYGVTDRLDIAAAVPIQHVSIDATVSSQLVRFGPSSGIAGSEIPPYEVSRAQSASGIGDIAIRAKYTALNFDRAAVAGGIDVRLPTGKEENLLGTGKMRTKIYAAVGSKTPRFSPHVNFGYTFGSASDLFYHFGSELGYAAGAEYVVNPRLTLLGDVLGRSISAEDGLVRATRHCGVCAGRLPSGGVATHHQT